MLWTLLFSVYFLLLFSLFSFIYHFLFTLSPTKQTSVYQHFISFIKIPALVLQYFNAGHISHRNLIRLVIVFVVVCVHTYSQLHCFSLVRSTVIGWELSGDISPKYAHKNQNFILINLFQTYLFHTSNYNT